MIETVTRLRAAGFEVWCSPDCDVVLSKGDCLRVLPTLDADTFDAIVTDPPAGIGFMGKEWDHDRGGRHAWIDWMTAVAFEMFAVLKPGGHALVWALPRTSHWTATALEDAGFEIRDRVSHLFGSGFPKSLDVSKAIDKAAGVEREVVGKRVYADGTTGHVGSRENGNDGWKRPWQQQEAEDWQGKMVTTPATDAARQWDGWGTALKPACEDWWLCRKPLSEKTVAANVLRWGTGALNIDGCRIGTQDKTGRPQGADIKGGNFVGSKTKSDIVTETHPAGRWPANVCLSHHPDCRCVGTRRVKRSLRESHGNDSAGVYSNGLNGSHSLGETTEEAEAWDCHPDCPCAMFPEQVSGGTPASRKADKFRNSYGRFDGCEVENGIGSSAGSAARFFYCAKASRADRGEDNKHPTVKNTDLMRWLCRLITPPDGLILDCFLGSGSTAVAAYNENFRIVGIEQDADYFGIAVRRVQAELNRHPLFESPPKRQMELI